MARRGLKSRFLSRLSVNPSSVRSDSSSCTNGVRFNAAPVLGRVTPSWPSAISRCAVPNRSNEAIASDQRVVPEGSGRAYDWAFAHLTAEAVVVPESGTVDDRSPT